MIYVAVCFGIAILLLAVLVAVLWSQNDELFDRFSEMEKAVIKMEDKLGKLLNLDIRTLNATNGAVYCSKSVSVKKNPYDTTPEFIKGIRELINEQNKIMDKIYRQTEVTKNGVSEIQLYGYDNRMDMLEHRIHTLENKKEESENAAE